MCFAWRLYTLLREHVLDLLIAQPDLMDRVTLSFEGFKVALDVGGEEDLWRGVSGEES